MRPAIVLGSLAIIAAARIAFGPGPEGTFDDRFDKASRELEELSNSIDAEMTAPSSPASTASEPERQDRRQD